MANLFDINREIMDTWERCIDHETGEIDEALYADLEALQLARDAKIENIACWAKNLTSDAAQLKAEAATMTERARAAEKKADSLKRYLAVVLNGSKFESPRCVIGWRRSTAVEVLPGAKIPKKYLRIKEEPDKAAIKAALVEGKKVNGCFLEERNNMTLK